jgi:hypothetical protein
MQFSPGWSRTIYLPPVTSKHLEKKDINALKNYTQQYMQACLDFSREHDKNSVWEFALNWQQVNKQMINAQ